MAKRTTRTNAETLENVRKQAEERGRALGRQDLAVELMKLFERDDLDQTARLANWFDGYSVGCRLSDDHAAGASGSSLAALCDRLVELIGKITEEANTPAF